MQPDPQRVLEAAGQIDSYLSGQQRTFTLGIDWTVLRPFQQAVLQATCEIPYGETRTYKEIAERIGRPHAARAVGRAEATNPMPLVIPVTASSAWTGNCMAMVWQRGSRQRNGY